MTPRSTPCTSRSSAPAAPTAPRWNGAPAKPSPTCDLTADISKVTDYAEIAGYGVLSTPALVVDEQVLLAGRVPDRATVAGLLTAAAPKAS